MAQPRPGRSGGWGFMVAFRYQLSALRVRADGGELKAESPTMPYPVTIDVERQIANRDRLTVAFRLILAIPHFLLVGGIGLGFALSGSRSEYSTSVGETRFLGGVAYLLAIVSWFT